jgi:hypothetical protein
MTNENELRPNYYKAQVTGLDKDGKRVAVEVQPFDIIDALKLGFYAGNVLKYLWRMGRKHDDRLDDAKKVVTYAQQVLRCEGDDGPQINAVTVDHTQVRIIGRVDQPLPNDTKTYALRLAKEAAQLRDLLDIVTKAHKLMDDALIPRHTGGGGAGGAGATGHAPVGTWGIGGGLTGSPGGAGSVQEKTLLERLQVLVTRRVFSQQHHEDALTAKQKLLDDAHKLLDDAEVVRRNGEQVLSLSQRLWRLVCNERDQRTAIANGQTLLDALRRDLVAVEKRVVFLEKELEIRNDLLLAKDDAVVQAEDEPATWGCGVTGSSRQALCAQNGCGFCRAAEYKMGNRTDFDAADERARRQGDSDVDMTIPSSSKKVTE